jgi:hypothetical protein
VLHHFFNLLQLPNQATQKLDTQQMRNPVAPIPLQRSNAQLLLPLPSCLSSQNPRDVSSSSSPREAHYHTVERNHVLEPAFWPIQGVRNVLIGLDIHQAAKKQSKTSPTKTPLLPGMLNACLLVERLIRISVRVEFRKNSWLLSSVMHPYPPIQIHGLAIKSLDLHASVLSISSFVVGPILSLA